MADDEAMFQLFHCGKYVTGLIILRTASKIRRKYKRVKNQLL